MVAAPDLGSGAARRGGSSPFFRTKRPQVLEHVDVFISLKKIWEVDKKWLPIIVVIADFTARYFSPFRTIQIGVEIVDEIPASELG